MEFKREDMVYLSGNKPVKMEVWFDTTGGPDGFEIGLQGDTVVDGMLDYVVFNVELNFEEAQELFDELNDWLNRRANSKVVR